MRRKQGLSLIELMFAISICALAFLIFMTVFRTSYEHATHHRYKTIAATLARSMVAEIDAHRYGARPPLAWQQVEQRPARVVVDGKPVEMVFRQRMTFLNGSFVGGTGAENSDVVTVELTWHEPVGARSAPGHDNQSLAIKVPVWR